MEKSYTFKTAQIEKELESFAEKGITEFTLQDESILNHKGKLLKFLQMVSEKAPELFLVLPVNADVLDLDVCKACCTLFCTIEISLNGISKGGSYLFDKKFFSRRAETLNNLGLVFGFNMKFACDAGDSVKLFRDRLNFALSLYPNHIDFPQLDLDEIIAKPTATFSTQDIKQTEEVAYACQTFYSSGRAVTWFLSVLEVLKITPNKFFQDFSEWQILNNCGLESNWNLSGANHKEIEKMQLQFLKFKFEEKNKSSLFPAVYDIVRLNGALSRCYGENEESELDLSYDPDELLSGASQDIQSFVENSFIENCRVKVFTNKDGEVDYKFI